MPHEHRWVPVVMSVFVIALAAGTYAWYLKTLLPPPPETDVASSPARTPAPSDAFAATLYAITPSANFPPRVEAPSSSDSEATSTGRASVCADSVTCARLCGDTASQFYGHPDCAEFRKNLERSGVPQEIRGELPPSLENLPADNACPDPVTCAARCTNDASPYYLKDECIEYRLDHPESRSGTSLFFASILSQFGALFK